MKITELTKGERALISRRRDGWSQREAADYPCMSLYAYRQFEDDSPPEIGCDDVVRSWPTVALGKLQPHEVCLIRRRRAGMKLQDLADQLGLSRWWVCQMEYGRQPADRLVAFWEQREPSKPWRPRKVAAATT